MKARVRSARAEGPGDFVDAAVMEELFPSNGPIDVDVQAMDFLRSVDGFLVHEPPASISDPRCASTLVELGPLAPRAPLGDLVTLR